jgi:outer membrane protein, heavy metal efflux system
MNRTSRFAVILVSSALTACVSVPRDAGVSDVQRALRERGATAVEWNGAPSDTDHRNVPSLLEQELTADSAVAIAMVNSPRLQIALAELGIARADFIEASTVTNPVFEAEIRFPGHPYRPYELRLAQSLIELIQLPRRRAWGRVAFDAAQMQVTSEVLRFAADVRTNYYGLLAASQQVGLSRTGLEAAQLAADLALRQHRAGNITDLDLENEQALYEQAKLNLAGAERQLVVARESLIRIVGLRDVTASWRLPDSFPELPAAEMTLEQLDELAAVQRLDLAIARREVEMARQQVPLTRLAVLDETVLSAIYERESDGSRQRGVGLEFPIPIFDTGRAARTRAEGRYLRALHAANTLTAESVSQLRVAHALLAEARARVEYYRDVIVPRRTRILELTKLEHNAMLIGIFQLLQAKQNELQAQRDFIDVQREYWSARTNIDRLVQGVPDDTSFMPASGAASRASMRRGEAH